MNAIKIIWGFVKPNTRKEAIANDETLTTSGGHPVAENQHTLTGGERGPALLQDFNLIEKIAHFNREIVPERIVHAKGSGAYGNFTVTHGIPKYTGTSVFSEIGKNRCLFKVFYRCGGERFRRQGKRSKRFRG